MKMSHDQNQFLSGSSVDAGIDALAAAIFENQLACWRSEEYWAAINQVADVNLWRIATLAALAIDNWRLSIYSFG